MKFNKKSYCHSDIKRNIQKHCFVLTSSFPRSNYRSDAINIGNVFSHITLKKRVCDFPDVGFFLHNPKLCYFNADVSFYYKGGHNYETEAKLNKARQPLSKEVSMDIHAAPIVYVSQFHQKTRVNERKRFILMCRKTFYEIVMITC